MRSFFPFIPVLPTAAAMFQFRQATIDFSAASKQEGALNRDFYLPLPQEWMKSPLIVRKLLVSAYGLVESGRSWQITVDL